MKLLQERKTKSQNTQGRHKIILSSISSIIAVVNVPYSYHYTFKINLHCRNTQYRLATVLRTRPTSNLYCPSLRIPWETLFGRRCCRTTHLRYKTVFTINNITTKLRSSDLIHSLFHNPTIFHIFHILLSSILHKLIIWSLYWRLLQSISLLISR